MGAAEDRPLAELLTPGMGVTERIGSDRYVYTITEVLLAGCELVLQQDRMFRVDDNGQSESQIWEYEPNPVGKQIRITLRAGGYYNRKQTTGRPSYHYDIGYRWGYLDPSF